jgi:hypothetical protein
MPLLNSFDSLQGQPLSINAAHFRKMRRMVRMRSMQQMETSKMARTAPEPRRVGGAGRAVQAE